MAKDCRKKAADAQKAAEGAAKAGQPDQPGGKGPKADDTCHKCGGKGHWARNCPNGRAQ